MRPMSFWFDGESRLYFLYRAETMFNWRSVLLTGTISEVPESERDAVRDAMELYRRTERLIVIRRDAPGEIYQSLCPPV